MLIVAKVLLALAGLGSFGSAIFAGQDGDKGEARFLVAASIVLVMVAVFM